MARERGVVTLVDGAQSAPHLPVDVQALGCDFFAFSGHKVFGPTGVGVLYGRAALLEAMPPWQGGGDMIETVTLERSTFAPPPARFEAGTPHDRARSIGLGAALEYVEAVGHGRYRRLGGGAARLRHGAGAASSTACGSSARRGRRPACFRSWWRACIRTTSAPCSTTRASPSGPATIARSRSCGASASPPPRGRHSRFYNTRDGGGRAGARHPPGPERLRLMSSLSELYQNVILEHNRSPRNYRAMADADGKAEGHNPLCGDQVTVWVRMDGDVIGDVSFQRCWMRHLKGLRVADDRRRQGQEPRRGRKAVRRVSISW